MRHFLSSHIFKILSAVILSCMLSACGGGDNQPANGALVPPVNDGGGNPASVNKSLSLSWQAPLSYTDGSNLGDLQGHHIYMKTGSNSFVRIHTINSPGLLTHFIENLSSGTYTFAVTAYNSAGLESSFSNPVTITL